MSDHEEHRCCQSPAGLALRAATPEDASLLCDLVRELAEFEGLTHECAITPEVIADHVLGPKRCAAAIIAECDGTPAGFALYYRTFSTFAAKPGIFLEDLYVRPDFRKRGIGRNPRTGKEVRIPPGRTIRFKPGKELQNINGQSE